MIKLIEPHCPKGEGDHPTHPLMAILRTHLIQNYLGYSDPAIEESLYETTILHQFPGVNQDLVQYKTTILNFCRLLERMSLP